MPRRTPAQWSALRNVLSGGEAFNGTYWWLSRIGSAGSPTGVTAALNPAAASFGAVLEHDSQIEPGQRCAVEIIASNRSPDRGFSGSNVFEADGLGFRDPIVCPICGLSGTLRNRIWVGG